MSWLNNIRAGRFVLATRLELQWALSCVDTRNWFPSFLYLFSPLTFPRKSSAIQHRSSCRFSSISRLSAGWKVAPSCSEFYEATCISLSPFPTLTRLSLCNIVHIIPQNQTQNNFIIYRMAYIFMYMYLYRECSHVERPFFCVPSLPILAPAQSSISTWMADRKWLMTTCSELGPRLGDPGSRSVKQKRWLKTETCMQVMVCCVM